MTEKNDERWFILSIVMGALIAMIWLGGQNWIFPVLALVIVMALPTIVSLGVVSIFTRLFERWWYNHCKHQLDIDFLKLKIQDSILGNSD